MKTILKTIFLLGIFCSNILNINSQSDCVSRKQISTNQNTYIIVETDFLYYCFNDKNKLYETTHIPKYFNFEPSKMDAIQIAEENLLKIDNLVNNYFKSFFQSHPNTIKRPLNIALLADNKGILREIRISYSKEGGIIPATIIENFEKSLLNSNIKLDFKNSIYSESEWVGLRVYYNPSNIINSNPPYKRGINRNIQ